MWDLLTSFHLFSIYFLNIYKKIPIPSITCIFFLLSLSLKSGFVTERMRPSSDLVYLVFLFFESYVAALMQWAQWWARWSCFSYLSTQVEGEGCPIWSSISGLWVFNNYTMNQYAITFWLKIKEEKIPNGGELLLASVKCWLMEGFLFVSHVSFSLGQLKCTTDIHFSELNWCTERCIALWKI